VTSQGKLAGLSHGIDTSYADYRGNFFHSRTNLVSHAFVVFLKGGGRFPGEGVARGNSYGRVCACVLPG